MPALPAPIESEAHLVPFDDCIWLNDKDRLPPIRPAHAEDVPERAVSPTDRRSVGITGQDRDLMAQRGVLKDEGLKTFEHRAQGVQKGV